MNEEDLVAGDYCGCCGNETAGSDFCARCMEDHVARMPDTLPPWERTYFAQMRQECPFQVTARARKRLPSAGDAEAGR